MERGVLVLRARLPEVEIHTSVKWPQRIPGPPELHQPLQDNHNSLHNFFPSRGFYEPRAHCLCSAFNTALPCLQECLQFVYKSIKGRKSVANSDRGRHRDTSGHPSCPSAFAPASTCFRGTPKSPIWVLYMALCQLPIEANIPVPRMPLWLSAMKNVTHTHQRQGQPGESFSSWSWLSRVCKNIAKRAVNSP